MESFWEREAAELRLRSRDRVGPWVVGFDPGGVFVEPVTLLMRRRGDGYEVRQPPLDSGSNAQASALRRYWTEGPGSERVRWPQHRENPSQSPWSPPEEPISASPLGYRGTHRREGTDVPQ